MGMPDGGGYEDYEGEDDPDAEPPATEWTLTEEDVQREIEESRARTEAAKAHIKAQEGVTVRINAKLTENGDYDALAVSHGMAGSSGSPGPGHSRYSGSTWPASLTECSGSPEKRQSARVVAEEILRRQERFEKFAMRRSQVLEENEQMQWQLAKDLQATDARCAQRQRERWLESRRRAFAAQQRRSEQQKVFRENQREQERVWECYYQKQEKEAKAAREREEALAQQTASAARASSSSAPEPSGWLQEEVYRTTLQSHQSYNDTIERWRQFEKENERRTEAHKKKLLLSAGYSYSRPSIDDSELLGKGEKRLRGLKEGPRGKSFFQRRASTTSESMGFAATAPLPSSDGLGGTKASQMSGGSSFSRTLKSSRSLPSLSVSEWEARRDMCARHHEEMFQQSMQKLQDKQESLQEARQRIQTLNKSRSEYFSELNHTWKERNDTAAQRRAENAVQSDEGLVKRLDEHAKRLEEEKRRADEERKEMAQAKSERVKEAKMTARELAQKTVQNVKEKAQLRDEGRQSNIEAKLKGFEDRATNQEYKDVARLKYEAKISQSMEFQKRAEQEMESREARSQKVLAAKRQSMLERCRLLKKKERSSSQPPGQRMPSNHSSRPSSPDAPGGDGAGGGESPSRASRVALPEIQNGKKSAPRTADGASSSAGRMSTAALVAELQARGEDAEGVLEGHRQSGSGPDEDDEGVFIKELESRSAKWLHELRIKKEKGKAWKP